MKRPGLPMVVEGKVATRSSTKPPRHGMLEADLADAWRAIEAQHTLKRSDARRFSRPLPGGLTLDDFPPDRILDLLVASDSARSAPSLRAIVARGRSAFDRVRASLEPEDAAALVAAFDAADAALALVETLDDRAAEKARQAVLDAERDAAIAAAVASLRGEGVPAKIAWSKVGMRFGEIRAKAVEAACRRHEKRLETQRARG